MPSPFPGMDPWLEDEAIFPDLHASLIFLLREAINAKLPPDYVATTKNLVWTDDVQRREPDVSVIGRRTPSRDSGTALATLPGMLELGDEIAEEWEIPYLEIVTPQGARIVTAIEILSPTNKTSSGNGRTIYLEKQKEFRLGGVNIVEIDLLRGGTHATAIPRERLERKIHGPFSYHVSVLIPGKRIRYYAAAIQLADPLPTIAVPLDIDVPAIQVELQPLLNRAYDTGRYSMLADYTRSPIPRLTPEQHIWAEGVLREKVASSKH